MESFLKLGQSITQSPDFDPKNVGIWKEFFAPPAEGADQECRSPPSSRAVSLTGLFVDRPTEIYSIDTSALSLANSTPGSHFPMP